MESNAASAQDRLLKNAGANYGTSSGDAYAQMNTSSVPAPSPAVEAGGLRRHRTLREMMHAPVEEKTMRLKQVVASFAILLSAGGKIAHEVIHAWRHEGDSDWFKPVPGMTLIYWLAVYGLQMDFVFMLGHTPTNRDPVGYAVIRNIASANVAKFFFSHLFLFLWQLFLIFHLPILALTSVTLAFFTLCIMYAKIHGKSREIDIPRANGGTNTVMSPSFIQGPISALFVFVALIHMPSTLIILITKYYPDANLDAIEWPLAWWILIVNLIGAHVATRRKIFNKKYTQQLNALQIRVDNNNGTNGQAPSSPPQQIERTVPVDLAAVIGLFWGTLAIAAGTGSVNWGPVMVIAYIGAIWQGIALFGALTD